MYKILKSVALCCGILTTILLSNTNGYSQETSKILLLNQKTETPIVGASYIADQQSGVSDEKGYISVNKNTTHIKVQHSSYGTQTIHFGDISNNTIFLIPKDIAIQPVTIIGVSHGIDNTTEMNFNSNQKVQHDAGKLLNATPEIAGIRKSGSYGFDPVFRGFSGDQLNIILDGNTKAIAACPNRMDPPTSQVSPNMLESVEIIKGPYGLRYGNSFGATIHYKTPEDKFSQEKDLGGRFTSNYNENGNISHNEANVEYSNQKLNLNLFGSYADGGDYTAGSNVQMLSSFNRGSVGLKSSYAPNSQNKINFSLTNNFAKDTDFPSLGMDLRSDNTWIMNSAYEWKNNNINKNLASLTSQIYYTNVDHTMDNLSKQLAMRMVNAVTDANTETFGVRNEAKFDFNNKTLFTGIDFNNQSANGVRSRSFVAGPMNGNTIYDNAWQNSATNILGIFGEYNISKVKTDYIVAARLNLNASLIDNPTESFSSLYNNSMEQTQLNPSISLGAVQHIKNDLQAAVWLGRSQRSASLTERFINYFSVGNDAYEMVGNPNLDAEENYQLDLKLAKKHQYYAWSVNGFMSYLNNYIQGVKREDLNPVIPSNPGVRQYQNIGSAIKYGIEGTASHQLNKIIQQQLSFAYTYGNDIERDEALAQIAPFDLRYSLKGDFVNNRLKPEFRYRYVAAQNRISQEYSETASDAFSVFDFNLDYKLNEYIKFSTEINNIFDTQYAEFLNRPVIVSSTPLYSPGRNLGVSFSLDF